MGRDLRKRLSLAGPAGAGIVVAHWVAYATSAGDAHEHAHMVAGAHRFFPYVAAIALGSLVFALSRFVTSLVGSRPDLAGPSSFVHLWSRLAYLQVIGFLALEALERTLFVHGPSPTMLLEKPVVIGFILQVVVGAISALLLLALAHVIDLVVHKPAPRETSDEIVTWFASQIARPHIDLGTGSLTLRGPPLLTS